MSVALLLGAASPALAKPGKGPKDPKPPNVTFTRPDGTTMTDTGALRGGNIEVR